MAPGNDGAAPQRMVLRRRTHVLCLRQLRLRRLRHLCHPLRVKLRRLTVQLCGRLKV